MNTDHAHIEDLIDAPDLSTATGSGRATWDERGNSIWEWQTAPGVFSRDISSQQLHQLEAHSLCLMDGMAHSDAAGLWSRNDKRTIARTRPATELVMPVRKELSVKSSGFDFFLKRLGLPA